MHGLTQIWGRPTRWCPHIVNLVNVVDLVQPYNARLIDHNCLHLLPEMSQDRNAMCTETYLFCKKNLNKCGTVHWKYSLSCGQYKVHLAVLLGEQVFLADFGFVLPVMFILKVLMELVSISGVKIPTDGTHQTHLVVHFK